MKLFTSKGILAIPDPVRKKGDRRKKVLLVNECFCQNGHNLTSKRAKFNDFNGILLKVRQGRKKGLVALSPIYGHKIRVSVDIDLVKGRVLEISCPECNAVLPVYSSCSCGADLIALFTDKKTEFANCVGVCNRVDCPNAKIITGNDLVTAVMIEKL